MFELLIYKTNLNLFKMNNLEQKYVDDVNAYLSLSANERDIEKGAMLMLKGNRNQTLYKTVIRKSWSEKIEYELRKILGNRLSTVKVVTAEKNIISDMEMKLLQISKKPEIKGKRSDHESLPDKIKTIPDVNTELYQKMRSIHEKLKVYNAENYDAEKRKPLISEMLKIDATIIENWKTYDNFDPANPINQNVQKKSGDKLDIQEVQKYRTALSRAVSEIPEKIKAGKTNLAEKQREKAQTCYEALIKDGQNFTPAMIEKLRNININL